MTDVLRQVLDSRIADLVRAGRLRVALYPPQYAKDPATGELRGWTIELGRALAARIAVEFLPVEYSTPPQALNALKAGACDVGFGAMDASRNSKIDFSPPVLQFDFTYLVAAASSDIRGVADADRPGVRIAVVQHCESRFFPLSNPPQLPFPFIPTTHLFLGGGISQCHVDTAPTGIYDCALH